MEQARVIIVGGGVVGCAIAAEVSKKIDDVFILEELSQIGMVTSSRNSGVVHSGIYYPTNSLKARHCVKGNRLTFEFAASHNVPTKKSEKILIANTLNEEAELEELVNLGQANQVPGLERITIKEVHKHEPHVVGLSALRVPSTGIIESEQLTKAFARVAIEQGASIVTNARLEAVEPGPSGVRIHSSAGKLETQVLVNSAGLFADEVAGLFGNREYKIHPVRGEYWEVIKSKGYLINGLVYPAPDPTGLSLGVHFKKTHEGTVLVGPNAQHVTGKNDYENKREPIESFCDKARRLVPNLKPADLRQGFAGLRPKVVPPGKKGQGDFVISRDPNYPYVIHLVGIDSPGLTAAISLAREVSQLVSESIS